MVKSGLLPHTVDHRDYDFHLSFGTVGQTVAFPKKYITDTTPLQMPNQNITDTSFVPPVAPIPYGCTDETTASLVTDLLDNGEIKRPDIIDAITNANARGGIDIRTSFKAALQLGWITGYFFIHPHQLDWFDSIRLAMISGIPEKRSTSIGTKWARVFEQMDSTGILKTPDFTTINTEGGHNYKVGGWDEIGDQPYLMIKSWQGTSYGNGGWCYMSRSLCNNIMSLPSSAAVTGTRGVLPPIQTVPVTIMQWLVSNLRLLLGLQY